MRFGEKNEEKQNDLVKGEYELEMSKEENQNRS